MDKCDMVEECKIETIEEFTKNLFLCLKKNYINKTDGSFDILNIVCENIDMLDFSLNIEKRRYLLEVGYKSTNIYLQKKK